ncbi:MAG TPA: hypothetical protein PKK26_06855 [Candidatus Wallbacteria bacterium]|nr:hypothetical protein [Candidatus Wallbacteria bacterium]
MFLKKSNIFILIAAAILLSNQCALAQNTAPVSVSEPPAAVNAAQATAPVNVSVPPAQPSAPAPEAKVQPEATAATASVQVAPPAEQPKTPAAAEVKSSGISAKDFILKPEEMGYGVSLVQKSSKITLPFKENPVLYDNKDEMKKIAERLFPEVKNLSDSLSAISVNIMTYKKDEKDLDFGMVTIEFTDAAKGSFDGLKTQIKSSISSFFREENYYFIDKYPVIIIIAHNLPEGKKEDIKWAHDLAQKKLEK